MLYNTDKKFRIRLVESDDLNFLLALRRDPEVIHNLSSFILSSKPRQQQWFQSINERSDLAYLIFEIFEDDQWQSAGLVRLDQIDFINRSMRVGGDISYKYRGKGLAHKMYELIFKLGFNNWNLNRLWLFVIDYNKKALNLYKKLGFIQEGLQRKAVFRNGKYHNHIMMSLLNEDYVRNKKG